MKKSLVLPLMALVGTLGACVTPIAPEDRPRVLNFSWDLEPETTEKNSAEIDQGELFFTWSATAPATHYLPSADMDLTSATTTRGKLFCGKKDAAYICYEDRNGNGMFDYRWQTKDRGKAPNVLISATAPEALLSELPFEGKTENSAAVLNYTLGLVFNGPVRGLLDEDQKFKFAMGEFGLGWTDGKDAPRDPTGVGFYLLRSFGIIVMDENVPKTTVKPLDFSFTGLELGVDGKLILEYSAEPVKDMNLRQKWEYDFEGGKPPEEWQEVKHQKTTGSDLVFPQTP